MAEPERHDEHTAASINASGIHHTRCLLLRVGLCRLGRLRLSASLWNGRLGATARDGYTRYWFYVRQTRHGRGVFLHNSHLVVPPGEVILVLAGEAVQSLNDTPGWT